MEFTPRTCLPHLFLPEARFTHHFLLLDRTQQDVEEILSYGGRQKEVEEVLKGGCSWIKVLIFLLSGVSSDDLIVHGCKKGDAAANSGKPNAMTKDLNEKALYPNTVEVTVTVLLVLHRV
ncbi:uncharacterized [Tachysurus ichikawai]